MGFLRTIIKQKVYMNILLSFIAAVIITMVLVSSILYFNFERIIQYHIYNSEKSSLAQSSYSAEALTEFARTAAKQLYYDTTLSNIRFFDYRDLDTLEVGETLRKLDSYKSVDSFIYSIYIYNKRSNSFFISSPNIKERITDTTNFPDREAMKILDNYNSFTPLIPIPRKIPLDSNNSFFVNVYTFLFYQQPRAGAAIDSAVIVNVEEAWLKKTINQLNNSTDRNTFIINKQGEMVISDFNYSLMENVSDKRYISKILAASNESHYFIDIVNGKRALIIYVPNKTTGWIYISTIPYDIIMERVNNMKITTMIIVILLIALGVLASFYQSRKLFKPIGDIMKKNNLLEAERHFNNSALKNNFLRNLILGDKHYDSEQIMEHFTQYGVNISVGGNYVLVMIAIDNYSSFSGGRSIEEQELIKFGIGNISSELFRRFFINEQVDMGKNIVMLLSITETSHEDYDEKIENTLNEVHRLVELYYKLSISAVVSSINEDITQIQNQYTSVSNAAFEKIHYGHGCILFCDKLLETQVRDYVYPIQKEKLLVERLMRGAYEETAAIYDEITEEASQFSYSTLQLTLNHIALAINSAIYTIEKNSGTSLLINFNSFVSTLNSLETLEEINNLFYQLFHGIIDKVNEKKSSKNELVVDKIIQIVNNSYGDQNLSVSGIADTFNISAAYVSRIFKTATGKSLVDYINVVRMEKAKEFVLNSDLQINEIVDKVGYTNCQYFHKVFKKNYGVTPNEMRHGVNNK
jgi:two-component system, response regulator YesN